MSGDGKSSRRPEIVERIEAAMEAKRDELAALTAGPTVLAYCVVAGKTMPGLSPERVHVVGPPPGLCRVDAILPDQTTFPNSDLVLDTSDCTTFVLEHYGLSGVDLDTNAMALLDRSIEAVNTYLTYLKASDLAGTYTRWIRPFGVVDLKFFCYLRPPDDRPFLFAHPLHTYDRPSAREMGRYLARRGVNVAGAQLFPADPVVKRLMCAIDLFNLSFFSESFITLFALIDDLTQNVIRVGREKEGVSNTKADKLRKEAQQDRFVFYLGDMSKKLGWTSLFEEDPELGAMFTEVNTLRNSVMHSSTRLRRDQAFSAIETLLLVLERLQTNPFGYILPQLPVLRPAYPTFEPIPLHVGPENAGSPHGPRVGHSE